MAVVGLTKTEQGPIETWPVSLNELKKQLRILTDDENDVLTGYLLGAIEVAEDMRGSTIIDTTYLLGLSGFPAYYCQYREPIELPRPVFKELVSVTYLDLDLVRQTLDASIYRVMKEERTYLALANNMCWPSGATEVEITYKTHCPVVSERVKLGIKMIASTFWRYRETLTEQQLSELPGFMNIRSMLSKGKEWTW